MTSRTRSNNEMCMNAPIDDGAQLILACNGSIMPWSSALTRVLTNFISLLVVHILLYFFTYTETPLSPLSYYVHYILLCCSSGVSGPTVCGIVDASAYNL